LKSASDKAFSWQIFLAVNGNHLPKLVERWITNPHFIRPSNFLIPALVRSLPRNLLKWQELTDMAESIRCWRDRSFFLFPQHILMTSSDEEDEFIISKYSDNDIPTNHSRNRKFQSIMQEISSNRIMNTAN
jgi:hypothetical protein